MAFPFYSNVEETAKNLVSIIHGNFVPHFIIVHAPPKSGKRILIQSTAVKLNQGHINTLYCELCGGNSSSHKINYDSIYLTKLHQKADKIQREEMHENGIFVASICNAKDLEPLFQRLESNKLKGLITVIHFDESDYGTKSNSLVARIVKSYPDCFWICTSASNEEPSLASLEGVARSIVYMKPGPYYRGATYYLARNQVREAQPFLSGKTLSTQGKETMEMFRDSELLFSVVRLVGQDYAKFENNVALQREMTTNYGIKIKFVDQNRGMLWGDEPENGWEYYKRHSEKILFVVNQTFTRSTEVANDFHELWCFLHDYRNHDSILYNTIMQALGRAYGSAENGLSKEWPTIIFGHIPSIKLTDRFDPAIGKPYSSDDWKRDTRKGNLSSRIRGGSVIDQKIEVHVLPDNTSRATMQQAIDAVCQQIGRTNPFIKNGIYNDKGSVISIENSDERNVAYNILHKRTKSTTDTGVIYRCDRPNTNPKHPEHLESWEELRRNHPEYIGRYVFLVSVPLKESEVERHHVVRSVYETPLGIAIE